MQELVSIILPVYNGERFLEQSIESCLNQTYQNLEIIIVDDCSTDRSLEIAQRYLGKDKRINIISNEENRNLPCSLNIGHKEAKGTYCSWTSDDNYYHPNAIEKLVSKLESERADLVFSNFQVIDENDQLKGIYSYDPNQSILFENIVRACFLYKREVFERNNGYDENLFKAEDYAFWLMASRNSNFTHVPQELYFYRSHGNSLTAGKIIKQFVYQEEYIDTIKEMYGKFFRSYGIDQSGYYADLFGNLHLHQEVDARNILSCYSNIFTDLKEVFEEYDTMKIQKELDLRMRYNIDRYKANQNLKTLFAILRNRPEIFAYGKRRSLRILLRSIFPTLVL